MPSRRARVRCPRTTLGVPPREFPAVRRRSAPAGRFPVRTDGRSRELPAAHEPLDLRLIDGQIPATDPAPHPTITRSQPRIDPAWNGRPHAQKIEAPEAVKNHSAELNQTTVSATASAPPSTGSVHAGNPGSRSASIFAAKMPYTRHPARL